MATNIWIGTTTAWATAANWSLGTAPATGEDVIIPRTAGFAIAGYDASGALLASFTIEKDFPKTIGSVATPLKIDADAIRIAGTAQQFLDLNNPTSDVIVTQAAANSGYRAGCNITGVGLARLAVSVSSNETVGVAAGAGETCTMTALAVSGGGHVTVGSGVTRVGGGAPDITIDSGTVEASCAVAAVVNRDKFIHHGSGASASILSNGGSVTVNSSGTPALITLTAATLLMGPSAGNPTELKLGGSGWRVEDPFGRITSPWDFVNTTPWAGSAVVPANRQWTPAAIS